LVARHIRFKRHDEAVERIEAHARSISNNHEDVVEAVECVRDARGPDEEHTRLFRLEAIADLLEKIDELKGGEVADPLEAKKVPELQELAKSRGVKRTSDKNKTELIEAIRQKENEDADGEE
jgi:hypothetical protein